MYIQTSYVLLVILFLSLVVSGQSSQSGSGFKGIQEYGKRFYGKATFYGYTEGGNCAMGRKSQLPLMYQRMLAVAINEDQYDSSRSCGACVEVRGSGRGIGGTPVRGKFRAYVHDRCPECGRGDLDLSKGGDGIWRINWKFIPCPVTNDVSFVFEGSNNFYKKIQVRGLQYPARTMTIAGKKGYREQDNFFIAHGRFPKRGLVKVVDVKGRRIQGWVNLNRERGVFPAPRSFNGKGWRPPSPSPSPKPKKCISNFSQCSGPFNPSGKPCCGSSFKCIKTPFSRYKHCYNF